ncbi:hypothetical protein DSO57_1023380 [Entomophthora muscae]|uniref:Uncharacterized protein n=1 Tax=Entomophthora muscae TaxID=34485 RepID=A0ACC2TPR8_9FUNG|nr:hypothetical protein DSO57_1023380 [Entomophthora muscae]
MEQGTSPSSKVKLPNWGEDAVGVRALMQPQHACPGEEPWIILTLASHMTIVLGMATLLGWATSQLFQSSSNEPPYQHLKAKDQPHPPLLRKLLATTAGQANRKATIHHSPATICCLDIISLCLINCPARGSWHSPIKPFASRKLIGSQILVTPAVKQGGIN